MAISPSFRSLCEGALVELDAKEQRILMQAASTAFAKWRKSEVTNDPTGLRLGTSKAGGSFFTHADLVLPFLESLNASEVPSLLSSADQIQIAAVLLLKLNIWPVDELLFAGLFAQKSSTAATKRARELYAAQIEPHLVPMRKEYQKARSRRLKGAHQPKCAVALKEFILEKMARNAKYNREQFMRELDNFSSQNPLVYKSTTQIWRDNDTVHCDTEGKKNKALQPGTVIGYFTEIRGKIKL